MTYVLTEVALQMLGYRFYDINGQPHKLNLNQKTRDPMNEAEEDGPTLDQILDIDLEELKSGHVETETRPDAASAAATTSILRIVHGKDTLQSPQQKVTNNISSQYELIAEQIKQTSEYVMHDVDPKDRENYEQMQKAFHKLEKESLVRELQITGSYRMLFEDALAEVDAKNYAAYNALFD